MVKKLLRKKKEPLPTYSMTEAQNDQLELYRIKKQKKLLEQREAELKKRLDEFMERTIKPDAKGHFMFSTVDENGERIHLQKQARKKVTLNEEAAKEYLIKHNLYDAVVEQKEVIAEDVANEQVLDILAQYAPSFIDTKEIINESLLENLVVTEQIPMKDFDGLCKVDVSYAMTYIDDKKLQKEVEDDAIERNGQEI